MNYISLILITLMSFAQQPAGSQNEPAPPANASQQQLQKDDSQTTSPQEQKQQPQEQAQQQNNLQTPPPSQEPMSDNADNKNTTPPASPKSPTTTMTTVTTVAPVAPQRPEPKLSSFAFSIANLKEIDGKEQRKESLSKFCALASLSNCTENIMKPKFEVIDGNMAAMTMRDSSSDKFETTIATVVYSPKTFTRKESIDFIKAYQKLFPRIHNKISPTRASANSKLKRRSSLLLQYEWNIEVAPKNIGKLFVLKQSKSDASYLIFVSSDTVQERMDSNLAKFLYSDLDTGNK